MHTALLQFQENLRRARNLAGLASALATQATTVLDVSDLFRASLVLGVSAFDHFVHEIARKGMVEIARGNRPATDAFLRFSITLATTQALIANSGQFQPLEDEIRERHGWLSFQDPSKIADAIRLFCHKELWKEVGQVLNVPALDIKAQIKLVADRRNKIAHEADMDPTSPGARWPIDATVVGDALDLLERTAAAIFAVVTSP